MVEKNFVSFGLEELDDQISSSGSHRRKIIAVRM
jgi:hypothetical protein